MCPLIHTFYVGLSFRGVVIRWDAPLPPPLQDDLNRSLALLQDASRRGHRGAAEALGLGNRVMIHGLQEGLMTEVPNFSASVTHQGLTPLLLK